MGGVRGELVVLKIHNILGKEIATLVNEAQPSGNYQVTFNAQSTDGNNLSSGLYFYTLTVGNFRETKSMLLIK